MTLYTYRCAECGNEFLSSTRADQVEFTACCGNWGQRIWGFTAKAIMHEHMNTSVGAPVSSMQGFKDGLARRSEEAFNRTGVEHNFQPVDLGDKQTLGVTSEDP